MIKIACIEDSECDYFLISAVLQKIEGIEYKRYTDTKKINGAQYDLILTDLSLPSTIGFNTLDFLVKKYPKTPIIVVSGMAGGVYDADQVLKFIDRGASNVISKTILGKNYSVDIFKEKIFKAVEGKKEK